MRWQDLAGMEGGTVPDSFHLRQTKAHIIHLLIVSVLSLLHLADGEAEEAAAVVGCQVFTDLDAAGLMDF